VGATAISGYERYLGLPAMVGRAKNAIFTGIIGRVQARLDGWMEKASISGREGDLNQGCGPIHSYIQHVSFSSP